MPRIASVLDLSDACVTCSARAIDPITVASLLAPYLPIRGTASVSRRFRIIDAWTSTLEEMLVKA